ncbi:MAG: DNA translocase FtsK [Pseudoramibacter sp.]
MARTKKTKGRKKTKSATQKAQRTRRASKDEKRELTVGQKRFIGILVIAIAMYSAYAYSTATPTLFDRIWGKGVVRYLFGNVSVIYCMYFIVAGVIIFTQNWKKYATLMGYVALLLGNILIVFSMSVPSMMQYTLLDMFTMPLKGSNAFGGIFGLLLAYICLTVIKKPGTIILILCLLAFEIYKVITTVSPDFFGRLKVQSQEAMEEHIKTMKEERELAKMRKEAEQKRQQQEELEDQNYDSLFNPSDVGKVSVNTQYVNIDDVIDQLDDEDLKRKAKSEREERVREAQQAEQNTAPQPAQTDDAPAPEEEDEGDDDPGEIGRPSAETPVKAYHKPDVALLNPGSHHNSTKKEDVIKKAHQIEDTLKEFKVNANIVGVDVGPSITRFEVQPAPGVKVGKIVALSDDLALRLATSDIRLEAPIPGKSAVGIEVPNAVSDVVALGDIIKTPVFQKSEAKLPFALGKTLSGQNVIGDISKMPHLLIAGATGSGKSVCINTMIISLIYKLSPEDLRFIMIDPKMVELNVYNALPHMLIPVVTDPKKAAYALNWGIKEMTDRYQLFKDAGVRDIKGYNKKALQNGEKKLPRIVIIIDELADLMMTSPKEVESAICRIAQLARACGIHLVIATQRPSVDVITGLIKANIPSRIAFSVASNTDSRTILDQVGAEKLLGKGDMLYFPVGKSKPLRVQGTFVSDNEINRVVSAVSQGEKPTFDANIEEEIKAAETAKAEEQTEEAVDELFPKAAELAFTNGQISTSMVQRKLRVGYARAGRIIDELEDRGIISGPNGSKPRKLLMSKENYHG